MPGEIHARQRKDRLSARHAFKLSVYVAGMTVGRPRAIRRPQQLGRQSKPIRNIRDHLAMLGIMRGDGAGLGTQLRRNVKAPIQIAAA